MKEQFYLREAEESDLRLFPEIERKAETLFPPGRIVDPGVPYPREKLEKALKAEEIVENFGIYNIACCHALMANKEKAYEALRKAVEADPTNKAHTKQDPDWEIYWDDAEFQEIVRE